MNSTLGRICASLRLLAPSGSGHAILFQQRAPVTSFRAGDEVSRSFFRAPPMSTNKLLPAWRATSLAWPSLCLTFLVQRTKTIIVEKVAAASVVARKIIIVENCSNSLYPSQPDGACFEIAGRWSDAALCGCGRVGALTCPERASVVRASNSAERSARPVSGHLLRAPPRCVGIFGRDLLVQCPPTK